MKNLQIECGTILNPARATLYLSGSVGVNSADVVLTGSWEGIVTTATVFVSSFNFQRHLFINKLTAESAMGGY